MKQKLINVNGRSVKIPPQQEKCQCLIKVYYKGASNRTFDKPFVLEYETED